VYNKLIAVKYVKVYSFVMRFIDFQRHFRDFHTITHQNILNVFGGVYQSQLIKWKKEGYIVSVRRGIYTLTDTKIDPLLLAQEMNDSYISRESALAYYQMIPEAVLMITSVSNERGESVQNDFGSFHYRKIASKLFCGFSLVCSTVHPERFVRMAEPEKALFDLIYFRSDLKTTKDFASLRLHFDKINRKRLKRFVDLVDAPQIRRRLDNLIIYLNDFTGRN
jgi:predicted transcriptional regulator of viral defense system